MDTDRNPMEHQPEVDNQVSNSSSNTVESQEGDPDLLSAERAVAGSLKLMDGKFGGGFYIRYLQDSVRKVGWLEMIIVYPDKGFKRVRLFKNSLGVAALDSDGILRTKDKRGVISILEPDGRYFDHTALYQYETPTMPIPTGTLWEKVKEHYHLIPIVQVHLRATLEDIYEDMMDCARERAKVAGNGFMDGQDRVFISKTDFEEICKEGGWNIQDARVELDTLGMFVRDKNSKGYQFSKRVNGERYHFYVIRKNLPTIDGDVTALSDLSFRTAYQTADQREIARLKKNYSELEAQLEKLEEEGKFKDDLPI